MDIASVGDDSVSSATGHFVGDVHTRASHPELVAVATTRERLMQLTTALIATVMQVNPNKDTARTIAHVSHEKFRFNSWQGSFARKGWYASIGEFGYRRRRTAMERQLETQPTGTP